MPIILNFKDDVCSHAADHLAHLFLGQRCLAGPATQVFASMKHPHSEHLFDSSIKCGQDLHTAYLSSLISLDTFPWLIACLVVLINP